MARVPGAHTTPPTAFWDQKALTTEFTTPLPTWWLDSCGLSRAQTRVFDAGCGQGRILQALAAAGWSRLWGADYSLAMVRCAAQRLRPHAKIVAAPLGKLPFAALSFDLVLCFGVLNAIPDDHELRLVFEELARTCDRRGLLLVSDFGLGTSEFSRTRYLKALAKTGVYGRFESDGYLFQHRTPAAVGDLLRGCFDVEQVEEKPFVTMTGRETEGYTIVARRSATG